MKAIHKEQDRRNAFAPQPAGVDIVDPPKPKPPLSARARALLGDIVKTDAAEPKPPVARQIVYNGLGHQELVDLGNELRDIQAAKDVVHPLLSAAHETGSKLVCQEYAADYQAAAKQVCDALIALGSAIRSHNALTQAIVEQGADWVYLRPVDINSIVASVGDPQNTQHSRLRHWLAGAAEGGHFDMRAIPADWVPAPQPATPLTVAASTPSRAGRGARAVNPADQDATIVGRSV